MRVTCHPEQEQIYLLACCYDMLLSYLCVCLLVE